MENASKALLIAGAILLVIALIAVGMSIFGSARDVTSKAEGQVDNMKVQLHNNQFTPYEGKTIPLSRVKELISTVGSNNIRNENIVTVEMYAYGSVNRNGSYSQTMYFDPITISDMSNDTLNNKALNPKFMEDSYDTKYDIKLEYNPDNGMVKSIEMYRYHK